VATPGLTAIRDLDEARRALLDDSLRGLAVRKALAKLPELSPHQQDAINALSAAIVNKLLHDWTGSHTAEEVEAHLDMEGTR